MYSTTSLLAMFGIVLLLAAGCKKIPDYPHGVRPCQIVKLKGTTGGEVDSIIVKYNNKGLPISMERVYVGTGYPHYIFRYDKHDRLTDFIGVYDLPAGGFETWMRYGYDHKKRIVKDTMYVFGFVPNGPGTDISYTSEYQYDAQNRIINKKLSFAHSDVVWEYKYAYDQNDNRQTVDEMDGSISNVLYDNKVNMHRLHPVWQFLSHDYSRNNTARDITYNEYGFPVTLRNPVSTPMGPINFANLGFADLDITYSCQ